MSASTQSLRILVVSDEAISGGHLVQASSTVAALRRRGIDVTSTSDPSVSFDGYDVVHSFGMSRERLRAARLAGAAVVVTPIWWQYGAAQSRLARAAASGIRLARLGASVARRGVVETAARVRGHFEGSALAFELADLLLPNSRGEADRLREELSLTVPMHVVPNGVDAELFVPPKEGTERSGVVCVARLEPHKNQLALIKELSGTGIKLTLVGDEHPHHRAYAARCRAAADHNVMFLPAMPQDELVSVYQQAAVHVLPSWFETTGLASLEAAATGCAVVTTSRGYAAEYFGNLAVYCDPQRRRSIGVAVSDALSREPPPALRRHVASLYTWDHTAEATLQAYLGVRARRLVSRPGRA